MPPTRTASRLRRLRAATGALAFAALGAALAAAPLTQARAEAISIGLRGGTDTLDPHFDSLGVTTAMLRNIFDTLVSRDAKLAPTPSLATSWKALDDLTWEFKLREGVTFHDGSPFTAEDVVATFKRVPEAAGARGGRMIYMTGIEDVSAKDDHTVIIKTSAPTPLLPRNLAQIFIIPSEVAGGATEDFNSGKLAIGTGPYKYKDYVPREHLILESYDGYWGDPQPWTEVTFLELQNDQTRVAALLSGRVDLINAVPTVDMESLKAKSDIALFGAPSVYIFQLYLDTARDADTPGVRMKDGSPVKTNPMLDKKVRQAISMSINRQAIVDRILQGYGEVPTQVSTTGMYGTSDKLPPLPYDPTRAKALLEEAGWGDGFAMDLYCTSDRLPNDGDVCAALGGFFTRVGIDTTVNAQPRTVYFPAFANRDFSISMSGWGSLSGETSYILQSLAHTRDDEKRIGGSNNMRYSNPEVDRLIEEGTATMDDDKRAALLAEAMEVYIEDAGVIPVVNLYSVWAGKADKVNYVARSDDETLLIDLHKAE
ncbi:MAG: ABC transporter substrate-binding protein [Pseudomonadota bacterium]|nr:ABC transporter substrate-binding protein [Pseudomonadota bacterium]